MTIIILIIILSAGDGMVAVAVSALQRLGVQLVLTSKRLHGRDTRTLTQTRTQTGQLPSTRAITRCVCVDSAIQQLERAGIALLQVTTCVAACGQRESEVEREGKLEKREGKRDCVVGRDLTALTHGALRGTRKNWSL